ncbi:hypothetical protein [Angustibacter sp. Root456]|uniref:hypothetical protein n=1 Tax=Angustibacter sp. Root456 TaxID=1736539 RepID=UPI0006F67E61|nr:hypothetical protein [Angustibacter sp. Root456]KQX68598.1 hypothetical protein ASD06_17895 [Angustibacter sp. Root456]
MSTQDLEPRPDDVPEGDFVEQHQLADDQTVPAVDLDTEADLADVQEQSTPVPVDDDDEPR